MGFLSPNQTFFFFLLLPKHQAKAWGLWKVSFSKHSLKSSCLQESVSLLTQCIDKENQGQLQTDNELKFFGNDFKKHLKTLKLCPKRVKLRKLNTRNINKKLHRKEVLYNCLKFENNKLRHELAENLENLKEQVTRLKNILQKMGL